MPRRVLRGLAAGIAAAATLGLASTAALAQAIVVEGNRRVDAETIRSYISRTGDLEAARRELAATGLFTSVSVTRRGGTIIVRVSENAVINRVAFEGNSKIKGDTIRPELQTRAGTPYSPERAQGDVQRILEIYKRSGRGLARVAYRVVDLPNGRVDVVFNISEGDKTGVKKIEFVGNNAYSSSKLRDLMTTTESNFLSFLKTSDIYDPDRLAADMELIRRYYLRNGYADFRVVSSDARFDEGAGGWIVTIVVEEGEQYRVGNVTVESRIRDIGTDELRRSVKTNPGDIYNAEAVEKSLLQVTTETSRKGYAFAQVRPQGQRDPASRRIDLAYVVEEGPRVYIERIVIRGNTRTRDYVIRREFDLDEGDAYNKVLIDRAERRLNGTGFFKKVRVTNEPGSAPDRVIVNVDVEDQSTGQFSIAGGFSTADGFLGEIALSESNFLGRGQQVRIAGSTGQYSQGIEFSFTEPYFMGYRLAAGFDLYSKYSDNTRYSRYESRTTGGGIRLGVPITDEFSVGLRYSLYQQELEIPNTASKPYNDCPTTGVPIPGVTPGFGTPAPTATVNCITNGEASVAIKEAAGTTLTSLVGVTFAYSTLDNIRDPRNGFVATLRQDFAGVGGDTQFSRTSLDARYYYEFLEDTVGIARVQGGYIAGWGGSDLRILDNFFLGPSLVRGFAPAGIGPRDVTAGTDYRTAALGGTTYAGASLEVQFPLLGLPRDLGLRGAVFTDAGTLFGFDAGSKTGEGGAPLPAGFNRWFDVNKNGKVDGCVIGAFSQGECALVRDSSTIRSSVGASLLWKSPLGPIRFDYAWVLSADTALIAGQKVYVDQRQLFRFSGGTSF